MKQGYGSRDNARSFGEPARFRRRRRPHQTIPRIQRVQNQRFNLTKENQTMRRRPLRWPTGCEIALLPWLLSGCSRAPSFDIVGSFFPAWLICLVLGILLATLGRWLLLRQQIVVVWPILVYPSLATLFTFLFWLLFFS